MSRGNLLVYLSVGDVLLYIKMSCYLLGSEMRPSHPKLRSWAYLNFNTPDPSPTSKSTRSFCPTLLRSAFRFPKLSYCFLKVVGCLFCLKLCWICIRCWTVVSCQILALGSTMRNSLPYIILSMRNSFSFITPLYIELRLMCSSLLPVTNPLAYNFFLLKASSMCNFFPCKVFLFFSVYN